MTRGLPIFLAQKYGLPAVRNKFTSATWEDLSGWKYDTKTNSFVTPEMKMVEDMVSKDPMADLLDLEEEEINQMQESTDSNEQQACAC